jgi:hypothetical protein
MHSLGVGLSSFLIFSLLFSPPIVAGQIAVNGLRSGSYQKTDTKSRMTFLRPTSAVAFPFTLAVWILLLCNIVIDPQFFFSQDWKANLLRPEVLAGLFAVAAALSGLCVCVIHWYKKIYVLVLDFDRRTYQTVDASGFIPRPRTGSWDEIAGVCIRYSFAKGTVSYYVQLKLKQPQKFALSLGGFRQEERAEAFAAKMSKELGLPLVTAPPSYR